MAIALRRTVIVASAIGLVWTIFTVARSGQPTDERMVGVSLWAGLLLNSGAAEVGNDHPRLRWALLIVTALLLSVTYFLLRRILAN